MLARTAGHKVALRQRASLATLHRRSGFLRRQTPVRCASSSSGGSSSSPSSRRILEVLSNPQRVGAEYGEGFLTFRGTARGALGVDELNERLKHRGTARLRHALKPDEAFGMIFNFDGVVVDTRMLLAQAWQSLAAARNLPLPAEPWAFKELVLHSANPACTSAPQRIMVDVLKWTRDADHAAELYVQLAEHYSAALTSVQAPSPGVVQWLNALTNFNVPVALVSRLDKATVRRALERCHLHDHFSVMVTGEDESETLAQRYLSAALQLQRPPNLCVAFDDSPDGVTAAHNCTMRVVGCGSRWHPAYSLRRADLTVTNLGELTVYNMRRLFANQGGEFMDLKLQAMANKNDVGSRGRRQRTTNAMINPI